MTTKIRFRAKLEAESPASTLTFIAMPFGVSKMFGTRARVPVRGTAE
jgi:hypothetical protein